MYGRGAHAIFWGDRQRRLLWCGQCSRGERPSGAVARAKRIQVPALRQKFREKQHACPGEFAALGVAALDDLRRSLDPQMARRIPPHVTAIYDDEAPEPDLMVHRLRGVCTKLPPIELHLEEVVGFESPNQGLYVTTTASTSFTKLRTQVLQPSFAPRSASMWPHLTILHPRSAPACAVD